MGEQAIVECERLLVVSLGFGENSLVHWLLEWRSTEKVVLARSQGYLHSVDWSAGLEYWSGITGMEYWSA